MACGLIEIVMMLLLGFGAGVLFTYKLFYSWMPKLKELLKRF